MDFHRGLLCDGTHYDCYRDRPSACRRSGSQRVFAGPLWGRPPKGGRNASLIVRKRTTPLAISPDLSSQPLEVCPDVRKGISLAIHASFCPTSLEVLEAFSSVPALQPLRLQVLSHPKNRIENT